MNVRWSFALHFNFWSFGCWNLDESVKWFILFLLTVRIIRIVRLHRQKYEVIWLPRIQRPSSPSTVFLAMRSFWWSVFVEKEEEVMVVECWTCSTLFWGLTSLLPLQHLPWPGLRQVVKLVQRLWLAHVHFVCKHRAFLTSRQQRHPQYIRRSHFEGRPQNLCRYRRSIKANKLFPKEMAFNKNILPAHNPYH